MNRTYVDSAGLERHATIMRSRVARLQRGVLRVFIPALS